MPDFRRLLRVRLVGQFGDGLFQAALFSAVFFNPERATSAGQAASSFAVLLLPYSLVGPFAGVFLDRWRRQRVLLSSNLGRAGLVTVFAGLLAVLGATALPVQALALVVISLNRFVLSGLSAALPHVVDPPRLVVANSLSGTLGGGAFIVGGGAAVGLRAVFGEGDLGASRSAVAAAAVYLGAALLARAMPRDLLGPDTRPTGTWWEAARGVVRGVAQGARHVARPRAGRPRARRDQRPPLLLRPVLRGDPAALHRDRRDRPRGHRTGRGRRRLRRSAACSPRWSPRAPPACSAPSAGW